MNEVDLAYLVISVFKFIYRNKLIQNVKGFSTRFFKQTVTQKLLSIHHQLTNHEGKEKLRGIVFHVLKNEKKSLELKFISLQFLIAQVESKITIINQPIP